MQGIKLVTFDATNTLLKFRIPPWQYYGLVARTFGYTGTDDILKLQMKESFKIMNGKHPNFGKNDVNWENWWREVVSLTFKGQLPASTDVDKIATQLINEFRTTKCWSVADGSTKLLDQLKSKAVTIGVISNFDPRLSEILRNINLYNYLDFVLTSYDIGFSKPDRRIFESAIKASKKVIEPSECLHIGDDLEKDYLGAKKAGWHALLVTPNCQLEIPSAKYHVFPSISDLFVAVKTNKITLSK